MGFSLKFFNWTIQQLGLFKILWKNKSFKTILMNTL